MTDDNAEMPPSYMDALMAKIEMIIAVQTGDSDDALVIRVREFYRRHFRCFFPKTTTWTDEEREKYAKAILSDKHSLHLELLLMRELWRRDMPIRPSLAEMTPWQWMCFKKQFDDFVICQADVIMPTNPMLMMLMPLEEWELLTFIDDVKDKTSSFYDEVLTIAALHGAFKLGDAKIVGDDYELGIDGFWESDRSIETLRKDYGFWESDRSIETLRKDLGNKRSVLEEILAEQRNVRDKLDVVADNVRRSEKATEETSNKVDTVLENQEAHGETLGKIQATTSSIQDDIQDLERKLEIAKKRGAALAVLKALHDAWENYAKYCKQTLHPRATYADFFEKYKNKIVLQTYTLEEVLKNNYNPKTDNGKGTRGLVATLKRLLDAYRKNQENQK